MIEMQRWRYALMVGIALICGGCHADRASTDGTQPLRFAVTDVRGLEQLQRSYAPFVGQLEQLIERDIVFTPVAHRAAAITALQYGQVDLVLTGPVEYSLITKHVRDARILVGIRRPEYSACVYTSARSGLNGMDELKGHRVAMGDAGSTSGHVAPSILLLANGIDPVTDVEVLNLGVNAHQALANGDVSAVGIGCHEFSAATTGSDASDWPLLSRGDLLPPDLIIAHPSLPPPVAKEVAGILREHWDELLPQLLTGDGDTHKFAESEIVPVEDEDYDEVRGMLAQLGVDV